MAKKKTKKRNGMRNLLSIVGLLALGIFVVTVFAKTWRFLMENSTVVLIVTGSIILGLILFRVLSPKKVKKSLFSSVGRFKA